MKSVVIVAGGKSLRYGEDKLNKQFLEKSVLQHSIDAFLPLVDEIVVVGVKVDGTKFAEAGSTRSQSVANGLLQVSPDCDFVAIHDGARPFVTKSLISRLFDEAQKFDSAVPRLTITDTTWCNDGTLHQVPRETLFSVQTPQVFRYDKLVKAMQGAHKDYTDESTLYYDVFGEVHFADGDRANAKITYQGDIPQYKVGNGFDVHAFGSGNGVTLGGVTIPFNRKLVGHSDADVVCHAVCDAVLSASGNKDIGHQFPDTDNRYLGADSLALLLTCVNLAKDSGWEVVNVSATVICQQPKLAPYLDEMSAKLASVLQVDTSCVNLSATTTEHLGALGNGDGIGAQAVALLKHI